MKRVVVASSRRDRVLGVLGFGVAMLPVLLVLASLVLSSAPYLRFVYLQLFPSPPEAPALCMLVSFPPRGLWPNLFWLVLPGLAMAVPVGFFAALWLEELAEEGRLRSLLDWASRLFGSVSTVLLGALGWLVLAPRSLDCSTLHACLAHGQGAGAPLVCPNNPSLFAAAVLALAMVPKVMTTTRFALESVPDALREASFALGSSKLSALFRVVLPLAWPRVAEGFVLALVFGIGEVALWVLLFGGGCGGAFAPFSRWSVFAASTVPLTFPPLLFVVVVQGIASFGRRRLERRRS